MAKRRGSFDDNELGKHLSCGMSLNIVLAVAPHGEQT
jgi:hypothetical protein